MQQPPQRKSTKGTGGPVTLKNVYTEQVNKLQTRHQQEADLLDDLRVYAKQRSVIEKEYAQALCKLAQQFLTKRPFPVPPGGGGPAEDGKEYKTMHEVWQTVLEETDRVGKVRLLAADTYLLQISEPCKPVRAAKCQVAKKVFDNLVELQKEITLSIQDVTKMQKIYKEEEHVAHDARIKAAEADDKVKRKSVSLFTSLAKLQQQSSKLNTRRDACEVKSTAARNDYLLSLAAANAHVQRYFAVDTPELMKTLDGDVYERMQEYFTLFCQAELHSCGVTQECFMKILSDATKINRPYNLQRFLAENGIFTDVVKYEFQPQDSDNITRISKEHQSLPSLEIEAKKSASRFVREERHINSIQRKLQQLVDQQKAIMNASRSADVQSENTSNPSTTSVLDIEMKMEDLRQSLRRAQTEKVKAQARLESLQEGGINIDEFINAANGEVITPEDEEPPTPTTATATPVNTASAAAAAAAVNRSTSLAKSDSSAGTTHRIDSGRSMSDVDEVAMRSSSGGGSIHETSRLSGTGSGVAPNGSTYINYQDEDECLDDAFRANTNSSSAAAAAVSATLPAVGKCTALYSFQGANADELDITENERLDVVADSEGDGWIRVRNAAGVVGLVPESYVQLGDGPINAGGLPSPPPAPIDKDVTMADAWGPPNLNVNLPESVEPPNSSTYSAADYEVQATLSAPAMTPTDGGTWARALYDYYAASDEELTFMEGSLIRIVCKQPHEGVDDGWWQGEFNGKTGAFPSLVVEEISDDPELASPQRPGPPDFPPPPPAVVDSGDQSAPFLGITLPTPNDENGGGLPTMESLQDYEDRHKDDVPEEYVPPPELANAMESALAEGEDETRDEELRAEVGENDVSTDAHLDADADLPAPPDEEVALNNETGDDSLC